MVTNYFHDLAVIQTKNRLVCEKGVTGTCTAVSLLDSYYMSSTVLQNQCMFRVDHRWMFWHQVGLI